MIQVNNKSYHWAACNLRVSPTMQGNVQLGCGRVQKVQAATFTLGIDLDHCWGRSEGASLAERADGGNAMSPLILLVEDEPSLRDTISDVIDSAGFRIEVAATYADGLVLLNGSRPSLLIANALLPDGDGQELAEVARRLGVPTLLVSGYPQDEAEARGVPFLAKPFRIADLVRMIRTLIEGAPPTLVTD